MPELPEVETVRAGLNAVIAKKRIKNVRLARANLRVPFPPHFAEELAGRRINSVARRGKYLLFHLSGGLTLIAHLGMSGRFTLLREAPRTLAPHDHVLFTFTDGDALIFNDARRFGLMTLTPTEDAEWHPLLEGLGPEPLGRSFNATYLKNKLLARRGPVKPALMDAELVVGVGNIYASEALFVAKIDPRMPSNKAATKAQTLAAAIRTVLKKAIASGGSSLRDFFSADGTPGYFQHNFKVYGRAGKPCTVCGQPIKSLKQGGRTTFYCAKCQK